MNDLTNVHKVVDTDEDLDLEDLVRILPDTW